MAAAAAAAAPAVVAAAAPTALAALPPPAPTLSVAEQLRQRELREVYSRYAARRDVLLQRVGEARDRLLAVQRALAAAQERAYEAASVAGEVRTLESAVARAAERIGALRDALAADEAALAARLMSSAARLRILRADADASAAALRAAELEAAAAAAAASGGAGVGGAAGGAGAAGGVDAAQLARHLEIAKAEQLGALRAAAEEQAALVAASVAERGARLAEAASRAEGQVSFLLAEERELHAKAEALASAVAAKRGEAEASLARRRALVDEVEQLKGALAASEAADLQRLAALQAEVSALEAQVSAVRGSGSSGGGAGSPGGPAGSGLAAVPAAVAAAEAEAREAERAKWAGLLEAERGAAERRLAEVRAAGREQYAELVRGVEARYVAEFEAALAGIASRQQLDAGEIQALGGRLGEVRRAVEAARAERARLEAEANAAHLRAAEELAAQRAKLASLRQAVRAAWRDKGADPASVARFLHRLQSVLPYSPSLHKQYSGKAEQLRAAAPILRAITRREVLLFRLEHIPRAIQDAMRAMAAGSGPAGAGGAAAASASSAAAEQVSRLRGEYAAAAEELARVSDGLMRDIRAFERTRGEPFTYRGVRLLPLLEQAYGRDVVSTATGAGADAGAAVHEGSAGYGDGADAVDAYGGDDGAGPASAYLAASGYA